MTAMSLRGTVGSARAPSFLAPLLLGVSLLLAACSSRAKDAPVVVPLTPEEQQDLLAQLDREPTLGKIESPGTLFVTLDQNLRSWREVVVGKTDERVRQLASLESALTRLVYLNFDAVLAGLESDDPEHRITAAAAIGFSRMPMPDEPGYDPRFPPLHMRAVAPLIEVLDDGDDALTRNALLSIARIGSPQTPVDLLLEMLVSHHDAGVRSNAAAALAAVLGPQHRFKAIGPLYAALKDKDPKVRLHAITAIVKLKDPTTTGQLMALYTEDDTPLVQANAAFALGDLGDLTAVPYLANGLLSKDGIVRYYSWHALCQLSGQDLGLHPKEWLDWYATQRGRSS